ncbi:SET domain-containing protein [Archangium violaceum]|uniref:SET domain-containing protein n=1 Tax=Archangium violaceum TaxID=83451 RepID=UPI0037C026DC
MPTLTPQPFELRTSSIQGQGAFATRPIRKGARIIEYVGQRISQALADERYDDTAMSRHHTFLFNVDEDTVIDAAYEGNDARFINHSCDPNCQAFLEGDRIYIYARRDISVGEELCYDYAYDRTEDMGEEEEQLYMCRCGSPKCRGTILAPLEEEEEEEKKGEPRKKAPVKASKKKSSKSSSRKPPVSSKRTSSAKSGRSGSGSGSKNRARTRSARG